MDNDLISREALKEKFIEGAYTSKGVREIIDNAPSVDAVVNTIEVRPHGEWKHNNFDEHYCSKCGNFALWSEGADDYYEVQSNFCPNCGAKMDGKEADNE